VLQARLPSEVKVDDRIVNSPKAVLALAAPVRSAVQAAVASGVSGVFRCALPVVILAFVVSLLLREDPFRGDLQIGSRTIEGMEEGRPRRDSAADDARHPRAVPTHTRSLLTG